MRRHLKLAAAGLGGRLLDVGAGDAPYRSLFPDVGEYITTNTRRHYGDLVDADLEAITDHWIDDASKLPFEAASFDVLCCFQVLSVIDDHKAFFAEAAQVLKPAGKILISSDFLYPTWSEEDYRHHSAAGLRKAASDAGFSDIRVHSFGSVGITSYMLWQNYIRSYPSKLRQSKGLCLVKRILILMAFMMLSPILSLAGILLYLAERNVSDQTRYAFNLLLSASLLRDVPGGNPGR